MANTYRMRQTEPNKVVIEMSTVSGWINVETVTNVFTGCERIKELKDKEDWVCKIYDEEGNLVGSAGASNQPVVNA